MKEMGVRGRGRAKLSRGNVELKKVRKILRILDLKARRINL